MFQAIEPDDKTKSFFIALSKTKHYERVARLIAQASDPDKRFEFLIVLPAFMACDHE